MHPQKTDSGEPVRCEQLLAAETAIKNQCENQVECIVDLEALHLTKAMCPNTSYVSVNCVCVAPGEYFSVVEWTLGIDVAVDFFFGAQSIDA